MGRRISLSAVAFLLSGASATLAEFVPGHIFVSGHASKHCAGPFEQFPGDRIWEVNPATGEYSLFVELRDEWCGGIQALVFTPDGSRLRAVQRLANRIIEIDSNGSPSILYDGSDGIALPYGPSAIAYDREGNFFVAGIDRIVRFPVGSDVSEIYADRISDPLIQDTGGGITIDSARDLYFAGFQGGGLFKPSRLARFSGPHKETLLETFPLGSQISSITSDSCGNLFLSFDRHADTSQLLLYHSDDVSTGQPIADFPETNGFAMALDPTEFYIYVVGGSGQVHKVSAKDGTSSLLTTLVTGPYGSRGDGIAVVPVQDQPYGFTPCPPPIPTVSVWGLAILALLLLIGGKLRRRFVRS